MGTMANGPVKLNNDNITSCNLELCCHKTKPIIPPPTLGKKMQPMDSRMCCSLMDFNIMPGRTTLYEGYTCEVSFQLHKQL